MRRRTDESIDHVLGLPILAQANRRADGAHGIGNHRVDMQGQSNHLDVQVRG